MSRMQMCFQCVPAQPALQRPPLAAAGPAGSRLKPVSGSACEEGCPAAGCGVGEGSGAFPEEEGIMHKKKIGCLF